MSGPRGLTIWLHPNTNSQTEDSMKFRYSYRFTAKIACIIAFALTSSLSFAAWTSTGSMNTARASHTAIVLPNGFVLVAGGTGETGNALASSELYNPAAGTWSTTGNLHVARVTAQSVLLPNGMVLTMGGCINNDCLSSTTRSAEIYNPASGTWTVTGFMRTARAEFVAVLLPSRKVLVAGGCTSYDANGCVAVTTAAELYDPASGTWTSTGAMRAARMAMTGTVLRTGKALIAGGQTAASDALGSSELYNPATGTFTLTGRLITPRSGHTATLLTSGFVLMAGGENVNGVSISNAELYNPATGTYAATGNMPSNRQEHRAVLLPTGSVLVVGGNNVNSTTTTPLASCAAYNPATGTWTTASAMHNARADHTATLLHNGHVLAAGGDNTSGELSSAELF
jgi:N-acetylneuraminic acid mutarotase